MAKFELHNNVVASKKSLTLSCETTVMANPSQDNGSSSDDGFHENQEICPSPVNNSHAIECNNVQPEPSEIPPKADNPMKVPSFECSSSSGCSMVPSRGSSTETYTDNTGTDLKQFFIATLNRDLKDREFLLKVEKICTDLINSQDTFYFVFEPMQPYQRMLIHRVAAFFGLEHNVDQANSTIVINKSALTRVPDFKFEDNLKGEMTQSETRKSILKRASYESNSLKSSSFQETTEKPSLLDNRKSKSFEEREVEYEKTRARIFSEAISGNEDAGDLLNFPNSNIEIPNFESGDIKLETGAIEKKPEVIVQAEEASIPQLDSSIKVIKGANIGNTSASSSISGEANRTTLLPKPPNGSSPHSKPSPSSLMPPQSPAPTIYQPGLPREPPTLYNQPSYPLQPLANQVMWNPSMTEYPYPPQPTDGGSSQYYPYMAAYNPKQPPPPLVSPQYVQNHLVYYPSMQYASQCPTNGVSELEQSINNLCLASQANASHMNLNPNASTFVPRISASNMVHSSPRMATAIPYQPNPSMMMYPHHLNPGMAYPYMDASMRPPSHLASYPISGGQPLVVSNPSQGTPLYQYAYSYDSNPSISTAPAPALNYHGSYPSLNLNQRKLGYLPDGSQAMGYGGKPKNGNSRNTKNKNKKSKGTNRPPAPTPQPAPFHMPRNFILNKPGPPNDFIMFQLEIPMNLKTSQLDSYLSPILMDGVSYRVLGLKSSNSDIVLNYRQHTVFITLHCPIKIKEFLNSAIQNRILLQPCSLNKRHNR